MVKANIHRRTTLEEIYPPDAFASNAAQNDRVSYTGQGKSRPQHGPFGSVSLFKVRHYRPFTWRSVGPE
jgi:hypothetical protein